MPIFSLNKRLRRRLDFTGWVGFALFLVFFVWLWFFLGTQLIHQSNRDRSNFDQQHNINLAFRALERENLQMSPGESVTAVLWRSFPHYTDGVVNPLWPWVAARFPEEDHSQFFRKGKWFNLTMMAVGLVVLGIVSSLAFSRMSAAIIMLLGGLGAWLPRAHYFQPEPLYYVLFLLTWFVALTLMRRNSLFLYGLLGAFAGLAYLAKASIQLLLAVFVGVTIIRSLGEWMTQRKIRGDSMEQRKDPDPEWNLANQFLGLVVMAMVFFAMAGPRLSYSNDYYGDPFHSYPNYWMWMDDFGSEAVPFMQKYSDKEKLASIPEGEKPSAGRYFATHTKDVAIERMTSGVKSKWQTAFFPREIIQNKAKSKPWKFLLPQRGWLLIGLTMVLIIIATMAATSRELREQMDPRRRRSAMWMTLFSLGCFAAYSLAYGWFTPIGKGDRFMLSLFLPLVMTILWICERRLRQLKTTSRGDTARVVFVTAQVAVLAVIGWRIFELVETPLFR